jgi:hypothetical protein
LISCGIILRSFVLRRRLRRSVEEALAAGVILPATFGGRRSRKDFGEKPTFYDAWVTPGGEKWEFIMVSVSDLFIFLLLTFSLNDRQPISVQITPNESLSEHTPNANTPTPTQSRNPFAQWRRQRSTPSSTAHTQTPSTPLNPSDPMPGTGEEEGDVQVSVLVAMPSPKSKPNPSGEEMEVVPEMVVGIAHLPYRTNPGATVSTSHPDGPGD